MDKPNIILLVLDAVRPDHLSCYGYERETTPEIDQLAAEGRRYTNAFSNSNWTGEAHPPIFTGRLISNAGIHSDTLSFPDDTELLTEILQKNGYRTFGTSAGAHIRKGRGYDRGFDVFRETHRLQPKFETLQKLISERVYRKQAAFTLTRGPDDKTLYKFEALKEFMQSGTEPVFAFFNCKTAHFPYNPPRPYKSAFCPDLERPRYEFLERLYGALGKKTQNHPDVDMEKCRTNPVEFMTDAYEISDTEWEIIKSWYDGAIRYLDYQIGELVESLKKTGSLENTYLIITADHGEIFGEKGLTGHTFSLYDSVLRVPLIIRPPGGSDSQKIEKRVSLVDLFNTMLEMAEIDPRERTHSRNILDSIEGEYHEHTFAEIGNKEVEWLQEKYPEFEQPANQVVPLQSVRNDDFKLIWDRTDHVELYRWQDDPDEQEELSDEYPDVTESLKETLETNTRPMSVERTGNREQTEELEETLKHLGYR